MRILIATILFAGGSSLLAAAVADHLLTSRIALVGDAIGLVYSTNTGIAFGLSLGPLQNVIILAALLLVAVAAFKVAHERGEQIGFGLILGGGLGNVIDRLLDGRVTDFVQVGSFPVFNLADTYINIGIAILLFAALRQSPKSKA